MTSPFPEKNGRSRIVIVEDDAAIAEGLALNLKLQSYETQIVGDGERALAVIEESAPDLVLLDISLPKMTGLQVLEHMRQAGNTAAVIVLSARQDEFDKVAALTLGADDYVTKPFALAELLARVTAVLRRSAGRPSGVQSTAPVTPQPAALPVDEEASAPAPLRFGDVVVDVDTRTVTRRGEDVRLTHLEFELLCFFCQHMSRVFSREELLRAVWGSRSGTLRTVDNFVAQLRAKLEDDADHPRHLVTVRGSGYRFDPG